jgi:hypothetical protein
VAICRGRQCTLNGPMSPTLSSRQIQHRTTVELRTIVLN